MQVIDDLRALVPLPGFRRLLAVRLTSQTGDGLFQAGLATLFFFSPESASTATGVATAFAVLLLPFTVVGPWAGVLLDRWRRRGVLVVGNLVRVALTLVLAALMVTVGVGPAVYVLALVCLSVNRFLLAALSTSLPRVVEGERLLTANALTPTLGAAAAGAAAGAGVLLGVVVPAGGVRDVVPLLLAAAAMAVAAALASRFAPDGLGPDAVVAGAALARALRSLVGGLAEGARHLVARRTPAAALGVMAWHRFLYGTVFMASILISRNLLADPADPAAGLAVFGGVLAASGAGFALAVVVTPLVAPRLGPQRWVVVCLLVAAASQLLVTVTVARWALLLAAAVLGLAAQAAKIAVDTVVQRDTADAYRGRAFALYDVLYNAAFVGAAALGAAALPDDGWSPPLFAALAVAYVAGAAGYAAVSRTDRRTGDLERVAA
ncbi:MFS transporter [Cellulomonas marina]|uniref:Major facilitator superfamily (MFS) profile domain-containing protein n=1 Tax=Cellulomonas marina TaxID=988821 RepID=A0A1I0YKE1_9CELL|nr:MFS transporter [Cellulomonas marina]GIG28678.1 MFS transporter [Cellulomonas marina]SFB12633.1 hypothetical protein SAMN05421867_107167 [Cellulomonas marina]